MTNLALLLNNPIKNIVIPSGLVPKGAYDNAVDYAVGDSVDYLGSSYVMFNNAAAGNLPTDTTYWQVLAHAGVATVTDTNSVNLTLTAPQDLKADLVIQDTTSVDLAVDGSGLKATVLPAGVDHTGLANIGTNSHSAIDTFIGTTIPATYEVISNKQTDLTASATKYPTVNAVNTGLGLKTSLALDNLASVAMNASLQWDNTAARTFDIAPTANTVVGRALTVSAGSTVTAGTADMEGGNLTLSSGLGKGTGASSILFQTGRTLTTGSTLQTLTTAMTILGSGNVGIGTTEPNSLLQIRKDAANALGPTLTITNASGGGSSTESRLDMSVYDSGLGRAPGFRISVNDDGQYGASANFQTKITGADTNALTSRIYIKNDGYVGIGTTGPAQALHISRDGAGNGVSIEMQDTDVGTAANRGIGYFGIYQGGTYFQNATAGKNIKFITNGAVNAMTILDNGNVGIGTTSPNANAILDVTSVTKAFMPPRMTTTQRDAIATPTEGMVVYNLTTHVLNFYSDSAWGAV